MKAVLLIHGKEGIGKSTYAKALKESLDGSVAVLSFSAPLKEEIAEKLGVDLEYVNKLKRTNRKFEKLGGRSVRRYMIDRAKELKEKFGSNYFAIKAKEIADKLDVDTIVFDDFRFLEEYKTFASDSDYMVMAILVGDVDEKYDPRLKDFNFDLYVDPEVI